MGTGQSHFWWTSRFLHVSVCVQDSSWIRCLDIWKYNTAMPVIKSIIGVDWISSWYLSLRVWNRSLNGYKSSQWNKKTATLEKLDLQNKSNRAWCQSIVPYQTDTTLLHEARLRDEWRRRSRYQDVLASWETDYNMSRRTRKYTLNNVVNNITVNFFNLFNFNHCTVCVYKRIYLN